MSIIPQGTPFSALPIALRGKVNAQQLAVLWVIQSYSPNAFPSYNRIAEAIDLSTRQVIRVVNELVGLGLIEKEARLDKAGQHSNVYRVKVWDMDPYDSQSPPPMTDSHPPMTGSHPPYDTQSPISKTSDLKPLIYENHKVDSTAQTRPEAASELGSQQVKRKRKPKAKQPAYSEEFDAFWKQYQAIKRRASGQSKPKAWEQYRDCLLSHTSEALQGALSNAVRDQARIEREGGFASPFPDCFRWLRDGRHEAFLQAAMPVNPSSAVDAPDGMPF